MKDLDKEIISLVFKPMPETINENHLYVATQIKTVILEALKAEMPNYKKPVDFTDYTDIDGSFMIDDENNIYLAEDFGYNQAIEDCVEVCNKLLGDSNAE